MIQAILEAAQAFAKDVLATAALIADEFAAFEADQRRHVAEAPQAGRHFRRDELAVRENLKVAAWMGREHIKQLGMHERFATEDSKKTVPVGLGVVNQTVHRRQVDALTGSLDIDPATLATQVATIDDRDV